ncbi:MAG: zf-TFIIB domain-containing protein [Candidatus Eremiobacterota bacterium]
MPDCPACPGLTMEPWRDPVTRLEIDCCPNCRGFWFDGEELSRLFPSADLARRVFSQEALAPVPGTGTPPRACPRCAQPLKLTRALEVEVDVCRRCRGIWLDAGELLLLTKRFQEGRKGDLMVLNQLAAGLRSDGERPGAALQALLWMLEQA